MEKLTPDELAERARLLEQLLSACTLCPHACLADRTAGEAGQCRMGGELRISGASAHFGEEAPLVGSHGSGTIFFAGCNLACVFCQNYDISQLCRGSAISVEELAAEMLKLQMQGCRNINLVTPTHYTPQIVRSVSIAAGRGLDIPLVYNCGGYESVEILELLDGIVDIYMPDVKYSSNSAGAIYSNATDYWESAKAALREMHRQVGDLHINKRGRAERGILVRHLVLPNDIAASRAVIDFIAKEISTDTYLNIMDQYRPAYRAGEFAELNRPVSRQEFDSVISYAAEAGLHRGFPC